MEEEMSKQWERLTLTEEEKEGVALKLQPTISTMRTNHFCLLVMIVVEKFINREAFKSTMSKIWKCDSWLQFSEVGTNKYLIEFQSKKDLDRVINGRPWSFDRWLLCIQPFNGSMSINEVSFSKEEFWIQAYNLPFDYMNQEVGIQIGNSLGRFIKVHVDERGIGWGKFLRIRVELDITKTLLRGLFINVDGKKTWVYFKYERLPSLCFKCGVIRHVKNSCSNQEGREGQSQYGAWLRAPIVRENELLFKKYGESPDHSPKSEP
ncbi:hypothetical protein F2P56_004284, partial [Juglans regia]